MMGKLRNIQKGFTIIEVLVVMAIAGLIMVIVFVAVPALQRSQRNEARNNDARLIANAINECMSNRNGVTGSCDSVAAAEVVLPTGLKEITAASYAAAPGTGTLASAVWGFALQCSADNTGTVAGTARQFALRYQVEPGAVQRCISG
jgi:prepilin-type N-terminal cleavage/methylation domain-containing protein